MRTRLTGFEQTDAPHSRGNEPEEQFLVAEWPEDVSPATADATLDGSLLTLTAWKINAADPPPTRRAVRPSNNRKN